MEYPIFVLNKDWDQKGSQMLLILKRWDYKLQQHPKQKIKYNHDLNFYTKDPKTKQEKAIKSLSPSPPQLDEELGITADITDAGDETTWRRHDDGAP
jgi:hypothetical protein